MAVSLTGLKVEILQIDLLMNGRMFPVLAHSEGKFKNLFIWGKNNLI